MGGASPAACGGRAAAGVGQDVDHLLAGEVPAGRGPAMARHRAGVRRPRWCATCCAGRGCEPELGERAHQRENKWRAARYGKDAIIIRNRRRRRTAGPEDLDELLPMLAPVAQALDCTAELENLRGHRRPRRQLSAPVAGGRRERRQPEGRGVLARLRTARRARRVIASTSRSEFDPSCQAHWWLSWRLTLGPSVGRVLSTFAFWPAEDSAGTAASAGAAAAMRVASAGPGSPVPPSRSARGRPGAPA